MQTDHVYSRLGLLFLVFSALLFTPPALAKKGAQPQALLPVTVQLNWLHQFEFAAFYAAIEQGYYRSAGLDVKIIEGGPKTDVVDVVVNNRADFGVANSSIVLEHAQGRPVVALAALMQHSAFALLAKRDRGIDNVADLDGKVVSCARHACDEIRAYLRASGLHDGHVRYVPLKSSVVDENFAHSDATDIFVSNQGFQIRGREDQYILLTPRSAGIDLYGDILFTTGKQIDNSPEVVAAFRAATLNGLQYAMKHQNELVDLILARYNSQNKSREHLAYEATKLFDLTRPDLIEPGYMSLGRWQHVRDTYAGLGMLSPEYPVEKMIYRPDTGDWPEWLLWLIAGLSVALMASGLLSLYLRRINRQLQDEMTLRIKAEVASQADKESFLRFVEQASSLVAHELRTPLAVLQAHLGVVELKMNPDSTSNTSSNLNAMKGALNRLTELLEKNLSQIFASTSFQSGDKQIEINQAIEKIVTYHRVVLPQSRIQFHHGPKGIYVQIAQEMFDTAMINLLENAAKYSAPNTAIEVSVAEQDDFVMIEVANTTESPIQDAPETLFAKHARGSSVNNIPGTGVGLHLVRLIAETHGGEACIRTDESNRFSVQLHLPIHLIARFVTAEGCE